MEKFRSKIGLCAFVLVMAVLPAPSASGPDNFSGNQGKLTLLNAFTQGWGSPGPLIETSPGTFYGLARIGGSAQSQRYFSLTSQGRLTSLYLFQAGALLFPGLIQAVNGRLYGLQSNPWANFSLDLEGNVLYYPLPVPQAPVYSVQLVTGELYGAEADISSLPNNAFVSMSLAGTTTVIHNFTSQEGVPAGPVILASDGSFYGISTLGDQFGSSTAMVYRMTPQGDLTILASYPDGRNDYAPGSFPESLIQAGNGMLYGTASLGGSHRAGAIFELSLDGTSYKVLHEFANWNYGIPTFLMQASDGNLYGADVGQPKFGGVASLFRMTTSGQYQTYYTLANPNIGTCNCWLTEASNGTLYGTTQNGGPSGIGTAWTWDLGLPKPLPKVRGMLPASGVVGAKITIYGSRLLGAKAVSFNGTHAAFYNISDSYVSATVPAGATTGPVIVITANGRAASPGDFTVK